MLPNPLPSDEEKKLYYQGIDLFNAHQFFDAHEAWEEIWHMAYGLKKSYYQGIIQCAVALEHFHRSNPRGVVALHQSYPPKFRGLPPVFMGLDIAKFLKEMEQALLPVLSANPLPAPGEIQLNPSTTPRITLLYDPFETGEAGKYDHPEKF